VTNLVHDIFEGDAVAIFMAIGLLILSVLIAGCIMLAVSVWIAL